MEHRGKFDKSVSLLCWAYNEEDSIIDYLKRATDLLEKCVEDYEIVLIDDCSTDKTYEIAKNFQKQNPRVKIFRNEKNLNVGISCQRAIKLASKDYLFWQTIDWSYDVSDLRNYLEYLKQYDIVQGVRRKPVECRVKLFKPIFALMQVFGIKHITKRSDTIPKAIVSVINYILIRLLFRIPLSDFQNITFYPTKWIQSIKYEAKSSFVNPEGLIKSYWKGMSIKEVPINFIPRNKGHAKGTKFKSIINAVHDIFRLWFKWVILKKIDYRNKGKIYRLNSSEEG